MTGPKDANTIKIYRGTDKPDVIDLGKIDSKETFDSGINKIMETVNKFTQSGYEVISSTEFGGGATVILSFTLRNTIQK